MPIDKDQLAKLESEHGKRILHLKRTVEDEEFEAVFKRPTEHIYSTFIAETTDDDLKGRAMTRLCQACCVFPDKDGFALLISENPGLIHAFGNALLTAAGLGKAERVKK